MGPEGGIVLGVDYSRRIVYMGDVDLGNATKGTGGTDDNRINNTTGNINSNGAGRLIGVFDISFMENLVILNIIA